MPTLYLTEQYATVKRDGETLMVWLPPAEKGGLRRSRPIPLMKVDQVVVLGEVTLTTGALLALLEQGVEVCWLSAWGHFRGRLSPPLSKNAPLRVAQHRAHNDAAARGRIARALVCGKLKNLRTLLLRHARTRDDPELGKQAAELADCLRHAQTADVPEGAADGRMHGLGGLLGLEGAGSAAYFAAFGNLLKEEWAGQFPRRVRRPPTDPVNALLSFGYTLLAVQTGSAASVVGLDPYVGFLHAAGYGKPALALDLMEEFRPVIVDSVVVTLLNNGMLHATDFVQEPGPEPAPVRLTEAGRRTFLTKWEERLSSEVLHPVFGYRVSYRRCLELQARLLAKTLLGELDDYPPFVVR